MTEEEAGEFVEMIDGAWQPPLTDVQKTFWHDLGTPLDARAAFTVLMRMFKRETYRPKPPDYLTAYRHELRNATPLYLGAQDRDEMPHWVGGWRIARGEGDNRMWPEEERGAREMHAYWLEEVGESFAKQHGLKSGYEWNDLLHDNGLMPHADRLAYMERFKNGEGPQTAEEVLSASGASSSAAASPDA